jgi:hypothetical protein
MTCLKNEDEFYVNLSEENEETIETECPYSRTELEIKEIEFGTIKGLQQYLKQKGEL